MARFYFLMLLWVMATACETVVTERGNGQIESQKRTLENFKEIHLKGNYQVNLKQGAQPQLVIVTDENLLDYIDSWVEDEVLIIEDQEKIASKEGIKLFITFPDLEAIQSTKASVIKSEDVITTDNFELQVSGAGLVELELEVGEFHLDLPGAGLVKLKGKADFVGLTLSGLGNLEAFDLESNTCVVDVSGVGGAQLNVKENLKASVNGIGGIRYKGDPQVEDHVSGIGTIKKAREEDKPSDSQQI